MVVLVVVEGANVSADPSHTGTDVVDAKFEGSVKTK